MTTPTEFTVRSAPAALRIDVDATVTLLDDTDYRTLSDGVGGLVERLPGDGSYTIWVNEEGKPLNLPRNPLGEGLWFLIDVYDCLPAGDWIAGPCVIAGPADRDGEPTPIGDDLVTMVLLMSAALRPRVGPTTC